MNKFAVPTFLVCVGALYLPVLFEPVAVHGLGRVLFVAVWLGLLTYSLLRHHLLLKKVSVAGDKLIVSNYFREVEVPLGRVVAVSKDKFGRSAVITVRFSERTPFGEEVKFIPVAGHLFAETGDARSAGRRGRASVTHEA